MHRGESQPVRHLNRLNVRALNSTHGPHRPRTLGGAEDPAGCNPLRYLDVSTLGLVLQHRPLGSQLPLQAEGPVPSLRSVGARDASGGRHSDLTAARFRPGRVQMPGIGVMFASRTPECSASDGACPGDAAGRPQPTVLPSQRTCRTLEPGDQGPVTPPPILR